MAKRLYLIGILILVVGLSVFSVSQQTRYAIPVDQIKRTSDLACAGEVIAGKRDPASILIFGSSRIGFMFEDTHITRIASNALSRPVLSRNLWNPAPSAALPHQFLDEYLKFNPAPDVVYVEIIRPRSRRLPVRYLNGGFYNTASFKSQLDIMTNLKDGRPLFGRIADFLNVQTERSDTFLTKALVKKYPLMPRIDIPCDFKNLDEASSAIAPNRLKDVRSPAKNWTIARIKALKMRMESQLDDAEAIRKKYTNARNKRIRDNHIAGKGENWQSNPPEDWYYYAKQSKRALYYFKKIVALSEQYDFDVVFIRTYSLNETEMSQEQIAGFSKAVGAEVIAVPYDIAKLSYPFYQDGKHNGPPSREINSAWLAKDYVSRAESN